LRDDGLGIAGMVLVATGAAGVLHDLFASARSGHGEPHRSRALLAGSMLAFAIAWVTWLGTVTVRFERNLMPAVVLVCAAAGHGLAHWLDIARERGRLFYGIAWALLAVAIAMPAAMSFDVVKRLRADDTRSVALAWIERNVPEGAHIIREEYTPQPDPDRYRVEYVWSLGFGDPNEYRRAGVDYVIASQAVYARFFNDPQARYPDIVERYERIFRLPRVAFFLATPATNGPAVTIYRVPHGAKRRKG
jgi:hypothetical protein